MVDLQSGDFKYNIPLMDVDGYPLNLSYQSGSGMDDEASWVGFGWSLNTGAINRQVRGVADDMAGDKILTEHFTKPMVTIGGRFSSKQETFGMGLLKLGGSLSFGVYANNYTGFGAQFSPNVGISPSAPIGGFLTGRLGAGISSDSQKGVDITPSASLEIREKMTEKTLVNQGLSSSLGFNTRSGLKTMSLGASFSANAFKSSDLGNNGVNFSYNTEPINPKVVVPYLNTQTSFSIDGGGAVFGVYLGGGVTGYRSTRQVANPITKSRSFGLLYAERGKNEPGAVMDFIRENDNPVMPETPNLAVPIQMPDLFSFTSQTGSGQFKLYRGSGGAFFDSRADDISESSTLGFDIGGSPQDLHLGITTFDQDVHNVTSKWTRGNNFLKVGDFQDVDLANGNKEHAYFKVMGEFTQQDKPLADLLNNNLAVGIPLNFNNAANTVNTGQNFVGMPALTSLQKVAREYKRTVISYLTAEEASRAGLDQKINNYKMLDINNLPAVLPAKPELKKAYPRVDPDKNDSPAPSSADYPILQDNSDDADMFPARKPHHISEITVLDNTGKRMVYGLPVYNLRHNEYSFALGSSYTPILGTNQVYYPGPKKGIDQYYHRETKPPYATSFLLTAILSADFVDKTGNGVTDDDQGTAIKFNYSRLDYLYNWRTPYANANLSHGALADEEDDKGSVVFGRKEVWYISSIETKTKVVYFITQDRLDGIGANGNWASGGRDNSQKQRMLTEVRLYSKADMSKPIKVVKFRYDYSICGGVPNYYDPNPDPNNPDLVKGKLTLKKLWFEYANIDKGKYHPYTFTYNAGANYKEMSTDRWGMYKQNTENLDPLLSNEEFPYANQNTNRSTVNTNASMWQLGNIKLPTGGDITVNYEADDYAYVQNRKAMAMYKVDGLLDASGNTLSPTADDCLYNMESIKINLPESKMPAANEPDLLKWFKTNFLDGTEYLYTKLYVDMNTKNYTRVSNASIGYDFIPCYAKVTSVEADQTGDFLKVHIERYNENGINTNTLMLSALQRMKNEYPKYAYPGYSNRSEGDISASMFSIITAMLNAISAFGEIFDNFYETAHRNHFATKVNLQKSFLRLTKYGYDNGGADFVAKVGGGSRVKSIYISDKWQPNSTISNPNANEDVKVASYGQAYDYTTMDGDTRISSGVASYEPGIGNDENPFKLPVNFIQKVKGGIDNYLDVEEPFGEAVFPGASVTYSKVTVRDLAQNHDPDPSARTGYVVNEFYTSRDFPVRTSDVKVPPQRLVGGNLFSFIKTVSDDELFVSQGYCVELNDMNGKPKAVKVYDQANALISATEYFYRSTDTGGGTYTLDNNVKVLGKDGLVSDAVMGRDIEFYTDFREQETSTSGTSINVGSETLLFFLVPGFLPHFPIATNSDYRLFRSAVAMKVVQSYGLLERVVKTQNGSSVTSQNIAYDGKTGDALITRTSNEFDKDIFTTTIPAYWAYNGMGGAYKNAGLMMQGVSTSSTGELSSFGTILESGDEFMDLDDTKMGTTDYGQHYWLVDQARPGYALKRFVMDRYGRIQKSFSSQLTKIVRTGGRNMLDANVTQIISLGNPVGADNKLVFANGSNVTEALKAINASASTYDETWATEIPDIHAMAANEPYDVNVRMGTIQSSFAPNVYINGSVPSPLTANFTSYFASRGVVSLIGDNANSPLYTPTLSDPLNKNTMVVFTTVYIPQNGTYYVGYGSKCDFSFSFDKNCATPRTWFRNNTYSPAGKRYWNIDPVTLTKGFVTIRMELSFANHSPETAPSTYAPAVSSGAGLEIYNNTYNELVTAGNSGSGTGLNVVFSTAELINNPEKSVVYMKRFADAQEFYQYRYNDPFSTGYSPCNTPVTSINPYTLGYAGNWKPYKSKVFQQSRIYNNFLSTGSPVVNVKNAGYINNFFSNWQYNTTTKNWEENPAGDRWVTANAVTIYDKFGQQLENKDALDRYSAAKFDFNGELPSAVASNSRYREIYSNTFEDDYFIPGGTQYIDASPVREFANTANPGIGLKTIITNTVSHTGNYSLALPTGGITLATKRYAGKDHKTFAYFDYNTDSEYIKHPQAVYPNGFEPALNDYIINIWEKDTKVNDKSFKGVALTVNGNAVTLNVKAVIEGWKLLEGTLPIAGLSSDDISIIITPTTGSGPVYLDDLRIHPKDAQMKTYAYDDQTMRLMAELDENGFSTFYEYDSQGMLVRVKKETERGVVTLKETRSSYLRIP
jgi:hypothetical protein